MLAIVRVLLVIIFSSFICIFGIIYCLLCKPFSPDHSAIFGRLFGLLAPVFGIKIEVRNLSFLSFPRNCIYIANHQSNYDLVIVTCVVQPRTITVGKKSILWIPLFGQLYWLTGNVLIDRRIKDFRSYNILVKIAKMLKKKNISIWIFPEGTRSRGRGLLPFKTGAFYVAIFSGLPIIPICVSNIANKKIRLNRWSNGSVIIEIMPPIDTSQYNLKQVRYLTKYCYDIMQRKINSLNKEVVIRDVKLIQ